MLVVKVEVEAGVTPRRGKRTADRRVLCKTGEHWRGRGRGRDEEGKEDKEEGREEKWEEGRKRGRKVG